MIDRGDLAWWVERNRDGEAIHLTLVTVRWRVGSCWMVSSVRSGRSYQAKPDDLLPHSAVQL